MNNEIAPESLNKIKGTIINVSFPRSGHRFLREIVSTYFAETFVFYESHAKKFICNSEHNRNFKSVNYVKTHDFNLVGQKILLSEFPENRRYLFQIRHPLESLASYYEFLLRHGYIKHDSEDAWIKFQNKTLTYWKHFCELWLLNIHPDALLVRYHDLCSDTYETAKRTIRFLTGEKSVDTERLLKVIDNQVFLQYAGDIKSEKKKIRQLRSFKYFSKTTFGQIECSLAKEYLHPIGIKLLFS